MPIIEVTDRGQGATGASIQQLARAEPPDPGLSEEALDEISALSWELAHVARRRLGLLDPSWIPFTELPHGWREQRRDVVNRLLQALILLGWIERP